jgi:DNA repair exonuclease SbcCD ATPase subunit
MKITKLKLHNYCQYSDREFELEDGLAVLLGKNGSGKSNLLNAIFYSLTGESAIENKTRPKMLKWGTKKGSIELTFEMYDVEYTVRRSLQSATAKMEWTVDGEDEKLNKATEINIKLAELMQTDANTLLLSSFMPQKGSTKLIYGTTVERMKEFSRLFRLLHLEKVRESLKKCYNNVDTYQDFTEEIETSTRTLGEVKLTQESLRSDLKQQEELLESLRERYTQSMKKSAGMTKEAWETSKKDLEDKIAELTKEREEINAKVKELGEEVTMDMDEVAMFNSYQEAKNKGAQVLQLKEYMDNIKLGDEPICPFKPGDMETASHNAMQYKARYQAYKDGTCPTCDQPAHVSGMELQKMLDEAKKAQEFVEHLRKEEQKYLTEVSEYRIAKQQYDAAKEDYDQTVKEFNEMSTMVEDFNENQYLEKREQYRRTQETAEVRKQLEARMNQIFPELASLDANVKKLVDEGYFEEGGEDDKFIKNFEELRDKMIPESKQQLAAKDKEVEMLSKQIEEKKQYMRLYTVCEDYKDHLQKVRDILHVDNFPRKLISAYRPLLQNLVTKYLSIFKQPFCIEIDEEMACSCIFPDNPEVSVHDLSGGQQMILTVAYRLAIAEMTTSNVAFISMDEPTNHLDADSKEYLAETFGLVKAYLNTKKIQMIVSTHEPKIQSVADYTIEV